MLGDGERTDPRLRAVGVAALVGGPPPVTIQALTASSFSNFTPHMHPTLANANQADADRDGVGDLCELCPVDPENDADRDGVAMPEV